MSPNVAAFLTMLSHSEGTDRGADPYRVCYGFKHTIASLSDHPAVTGEWRGEQLPDQLCINVGLSAPCWSTAAGRYQMTKSTWLSLKAQLRLTCFDGPSQDDACIQLIKSKNAFSLINEGDLAGAIANCRSEWASLPGSTSGQPQRDFATLASAYQSAGGALA
jgi:muramidase (phage lysozyme)